MEKYNASASWSRYRAILDRQFGIQLSHEPVETSRSLRGHDVHIDDWRASAEQKGTLILVHGAGGNGRILAPFCDIAARQGWRALAPSRFFQTMHARKFHGRELDCRLVLVHSGADAWTPTTLSRAAFDRVRGPKHFRELTNGSHLPLEQPAFRELEEEMTSALEASAG